jgi:hypothetical protein
VCDRGYCVVEGSERLRAGCALIQHMDETWTGAPAEVADDCGGDDRGTRGAGIASGAPGVRNGAARFDGRGCIEVPDSAALRAEGGLTLSAWVMPTALDDHRVFGIISKRTDMAVDSAYSVYLWANRIWIDLDGNDDRFSGTTQLRSGAWAQLTVVFDGARPETRRVTLYVDGELDVVASESSRQLGPYPSALHIGCLPSSTASQNFVGSLDEVAIWTRALDEREVAHWYDQTRARSGT